MAIAVAVPTPELQMSGVPVAETLLDNPVIHEVSEIAPIPVLQAVPVRKNPVTPGCIGGVTKIPLL